MAFTGKRDAYPTLFNSLLNVTSTFEFQELLDANLGSTCNLPVVDHERDSLPSFLRGSPVAPRQEARSQAGVLRWIEVI